MIKSKKNLMALALASVISVSTLTSCGEEVASESVTDISIEEEVPSEGTPVDEVTAETTSSEEVQADETKVFDPYTHVFFVRINNQTNIISTANVKGGQVEIPEGYEILDIEPWTDAIRDGSRTEGYDVWFINNKSVEATPVYNDVIDGYDYSAPGTVIELTNEESVKSKTLTP